VNRDGHDRRAAFESQAAHPRSRLVPDLLGARTTTLGVDHDHSAAREDLPRGLHRLLIVVAAAHGEGAGMLDRPTERAAEELRLRHEADAPAQVHRDEEMVERREVVGRDDHGPRRRHQLAVDRACAIDDLAERHEDQAQQVLDPVRAVLARPAVVLREVLRRAFVEVDLRLHIDVRT